MNNASRHKQYQPLNDYSLLLKSDADFGSCNLPYETDQLRLALSEFLEQPYEIDGIQFHHLGSVKWGVYAFFDYDLEPIYVGQTKESLSTRIRRHLTNQRSDAVAMNVLDPLEVHTIAVWPLASLQKNSSNDPHAIQYLNALEATIYKKLSDQSKYKKILNEKPPLSTTKRVKVPKPIKSRVVPDEVLWLRQHPDLRIARRAMTIAKLAQVISERKVQKGLRGTLVAQAARLHSLALRRFQSVSDGFED